jgi:hypothetical protein
MRAKISPTRNTSPAIDPITIPAIAPPDSPLSELDPPGVDVVVAGVVEVGDEVSLAVGAAVEKVM